MLDFFSSKAAIAEDRPVLMLAPMEGITNSIFRNEIIAVGGPDIVATEFIRITSEKQRVKKFQRHSCPLQIQIMGCSPGIIQGNLEFLKKAEVLCAADWIDLNVGCPSKRVTAHGSGAALLQTPRTLVSIITGLRTAHSGPLSIKTRIGFDTDQNFSEIVQALKDCPLDFITIHARTKQAGYTPGINLKQLAHAVHALPYPVIGNGDIWSIDHAQKMISETGVRGIMTGRGAVQDPCLLRDIRDHYTGKEVLPRSKDFYLQFATRLLAEYIKYGNTVNKPDRFLGTFKEFAVWLSKNPIVGSELFQNIKRSTKLVEIQAILNHMTLSAADSMGAYGS